MRKTILFVLLAGAFFSCSKQQIKNDLTVAFDLPQKVEFTAPGSLSLGLVNLPLIPITPDWSGNFSANKSDVNHLKSLNATSIVLHVKSPAGHNLHFLQTIYVYISANGQNEAKLAFKDPVPDNVDSTLALDIPVLDVSPYVKQNQFNIRVSFQERETFTQDIKIEADMTFHAVAYLLN